MENGRIYLIKDIAELSGLSGHTVKYYLRRGLIKEIGRSPGTNFRYFDDNTLDTLKKIRGFRKNNFSINKIAEMLEGRR
ncbi:MAG: MerR family transcriptional regulator [Candidatus Omnitrophica bacterium]|nr:MerR family transcriptional regulator [Candidatus Omnitrophota bacterium]